MSLKLRVELESAFDLNKRQMCAYGHRQKKKENYTVHELQKKSSLKFY